MNEHENKYELFNMAEWISNPTTFRDKKGAIRSFRKYLWLGNLGVTNVNATQVIIPALPGYLEIYIDPISEYILAGNKSSGWTVYSLEGQKLNFFLPMSLNSAISMLNDK